MSKISLKIGKGVESPHHLKASQDPTHLRETNIDGEVVGVDEEQQLPSLGDDRQAIVEAVAEEEAGVEVPVSTVELSPGTESP